MNMWWLSQIPFPRTPILIYSWASSKLAPGLHIHGGVQVEWWPYGIFQSWILLRTSEHHHVKWCRIPSKRSLRTRTFTETSSCPDIRPNLNIVMGRWGAQVCSIIQHRRRFQNQNNVFSGDTAWLYTAILCCPYSFIQPTSWLYHTECLTPGHQVIACEDACLWLSVLNRFGWCSSSHWFKGHSRHSCLGRNLKWQRRGSRLPWTS